MTLWQRILRASFVIREGQAHRVIFYYFGEEPTYLEDPYVTVFSNGCVEVEGKSENVSTHVQNVEILWRNRTPQPVPNMIKGRNLSLIKTASTEDSAH